MAATEQAPATPPRPRVGRILAAALAVPGVLLVGGAAQADEAPERGQISARYLHYQDSQPGWNRITVRAPAVQVLVPLSRQWAVEAGAMVDQVSGASPRYYSDISGASRMSDRRTSLDARVTHYRERGSVRFGVARSDENDYRSQAASLELAQSSDDQNTRWQLSAALTRDRIDPVNRQVVGETRRLGELQLSVTQAWSRRDLVQASLALGDGRGYFDDPYKFDDRRPRVRRQQVAQLRWHHRLDAQNATLRTSLRHYRDSFGVRGHSAEFAWVQTLSDTLEWTPLLRAYSQRAADFYVDPSPDPQVYPDAPVPAAFHSADQRLAAFGALTVGMKLAWRVDPRWIVDTRVERYEQRSAWRVGGPGSPGLAPFRALWLQVGVTFELP